jgi:hypothetical protein
MSASDSKKGDGILGVLREAEELLETMTGLRSPGPGAAVL